MIWVMQLRSLSFRICALWNKERGPFSEPILCCTLKTTPQFPNSLRITQKTKSAVTLKWNVSSICFLYMQTNFNFYHIWMKGLKIWDKGFKTEKHNCKVNSIWDFIYDLYKPFWRLLYRNLYLFLLRLTTTLKGFHH